MSHVDVLMCCPGVDVLLPCPSEVPLLSERSFLSTLLSHGSFPTGRQIENKFRSDNTGSMGTFAIHG